MKDILFYYVIPLIISIVFYLFIGLIIWNIVYSFLDLQTITITQLSDFKLCSYSIPVILALCGTLLLLMESGRWFVFIALVNLAIAIAVNHWQGAWDSVVVILNWIYNIINVCELWFVFMVLIVLFKEKLLSDKKRN